MTRSGNYLSADGQSGIPYSRRLAHLVALPALTTARERLDEALGPELAQFLVGALTAQGRLGSSSPYVRT